MPQSVTGPSTRRLVADRGRRASSECARPLLQFRTRMGYRDPTEAALHLRAALTAEHARMESFLADAERARRRRHRRVVARGTPVVVTTPTDARMGPDEGHARRGRLRARAGPL